MKSIEINKLVVMFVIAMGNAIGCGFTYISKLPTCFSKHITLNKVYVDFICLRVNSKLELECWFVDEDENTFSLSLDEVKCVKPTLWVSIITHVFDMIENLKEC